MAVVRKKTDDKILKTLREIVSIGGNKQCFDCGQRGPTYVNMTIGSFVCTRCSGVLRGLTPPHRVKSISMATFITDELEFIKNHGNDACAKTWLGLWDPKRVHTQDHRDLMIDKYERKRYYLEPASPLKSLTNTQLAPAISTQNHHHFNGNSTQDEQQQQQQQHKLVRSNAQRNRSHQTNGKNGGSSNIGNGEQSTTKYRLNNLDNKFTPDSEFVADFSSAQIFNNDNNNIINNNSNNNQKNNYSNGFFNGSPQLNNKTTNNLILNNNKNNNNNNNFANNNNNNNNNNNQNNQKYGVINGGSVSALINGQQNGMVVTENANENFADFEHNTIYNAAAKNDISNTSSISSIDNGGSTTINRTNTRTTIDDNFISIMNSSNTNLTTTITTNATNNTINFTAAVSAPATTIDSSTFKSFTNNSSHGGISCLSNDDFNSDSGVAAYFGIGGGGGGGGSGGSGFSVGIGSGFSGGNGCGSNNINTTNQWNIWQQFQWPLINNNNNNTIANTNYHEQNRWSLPMSISSTSNSSNSTGTFNSNSSINSTPLADRYAALKDLDEQLREVKDKEINNTTNPILISQQQQQHHTNGGGGGLIGSPSAASNSLHLQQNQQLHHHLQHQQVINPFKQQQLLEQQQMISNPFQAAVVQQQQQQQQHQVFQHPSQQQQQQQQHFQNNFNGWPINFNNGQIGAVGNSVGGILMSAQQNGISLQNLQNVMINQQQQLQQQNRPNVLFQQNGFPHAQKVSNPFAASTVGSSNHNPFL